LPQGIEYVSQIRSLVNVRKEGLISEAGPRRQWKSLLLNGSHYVCLICAFSTIISSVVQSAEHSAPARKMAQESIVLLQNDGPLPLTGNAGSPAFGVSADDIGMVCSNDDSLNIHDTKKILEGLRSNPGLTVYYRVL
jgi:beta-glucosidase-like glycosyl hydrolase